EVGPMAPYHMGGVRVNANMETRIKGLFAAGEVVGGANGANRLSGNAITEALVFGERAGSSAAEAVKHTQGDWNSELTGVALERVRALKNRRSNGGGSPVAPQRGLQKFMWGKRGALCVRGR